MNTHTYIVETTTELLAAVKSASGGDIIKLKPGSYSAVTLANLSYDSDVTITSLDSNDRAIFLDKLRLENVTNLHLDDLEFGMSELPATGANSSYRAMLYVSGSEGITLTNSKIEGLIADRTQGNFLAEPHNALIEGYAAGYGIFLRSSSDLTIQNTEISTTYLGIGLLDVKDTTISHNYIHDLRVDAIAGTDMINTVIEENLFMNLNPYRKEEGVVNGYTDDHADFIQYWATGAKLGVDQFHVRDNVFVQEEGETQTIFGRLNLTGSEPEGVALTNFEISGNLIYSGHVNAIAISGVTNAKVFDNTLVPNVKALEDFRNLPHISLSYDGPSASQEGFDINSPVVQQTRNIDIYDNVGAESYGVPVLMKAYTFKVDDIEEVKEALDFRIWGNSWMSSRNISEENYLELVKFAANADNDEIVLQIDPTSETIHDGAGSKYYYDQASLQTFLDNLDLEIPAKVELADFASGAVNLTVDNEVDQEPTDGAAAQDIVTEEEPAAEPQQVLARTSQAVVAEPVVDDVVQEPVAAAAVEPVVKDVVQEPVAVAAKVTVEPVVEDVVQEPVVVAAKVTVEPVVEDVVQEPVAVAAEVTVEPVVEDVVQEPVVVAPKVTVEPVVEDVVQEPVAPLEPVVSQAAEQNIPVPVPVAEEVPVVMAPPAMVNEDMMVVMLNGATSEYEIYLQEDGTFSITDISTGVRDDIQEVDAVFFRGDTAFYSVDGSTGETKLLEPIDHRDTYSKLLKIGNQLNPQDDMVETQIGTEDDTDAPLLVESGVDFISGTAGKDIILAQNSHAVILGDNDVDTLVMGGSSEHYIHHAKDDGMHSLFSARTGEITEFTDIEQIYFEDSDQLHFVGSESDLPRMNKSAYASEYARIEQALSSIDSSYEELG